jgi:phosphate transport system substrate-binding protein
VPGRDLAALVLLFLALVALLTACGEPVATPEPVFLRASGSTAMAPLVAELAAAFGDQQPTVSLEVTSLGTQFGLEALRAGETDIALASWLPGDLESGWQATAIARDGIAVIVHPSNPVDGLGLLQLQDLFAGRVYQWAAVGGRAAQGEVQTVSREEGAGTRAAFEALVMADRAVTPWAVVAASSQAVVENVARHRQAIGYVSMGWVTPEVKVLKVEAELPTGKSAGQGSYPITRDLWLVTMEASSDPVQDFVDFALSPAGQQIVGQDYGRVR